MGKNYVIRIKKPIKRKRKITEICAFEWPRVAEAVKSGDCLVIDRKGDAVLDISPHAKKSFNDYDYDVKYADRVSHCMVLVRFTVKWQGY